MNEPRFTDSLLFKAFCVTVFLSLICFLLIYFKDLMKPLALGVLLWYLIKAFNGTFEKIKFRGKPLNLWLRRFMALLVIVVVVDVIVQIFVSNISDILEHYAEYQATLNARIMALGNQIGLPEITQSIKNQLGGLNIQRILEDLLTSISAMVGNIFLIIIYAIFILLEEHHFSAKLALIFKHPWQVEKMQRVVDQIYVSTNKYVAVKAFVSALTGIAAYVVMVIVGVDFAFLWALLIFALNFIPYIGSIIATLLPALFSIVQFGSLWPFFWVFGGITIIQNVIGNYLEPVVMGKSLNLSPLVVVITLSFWGFVWDLLGMLLAVPITSILLIIMAQFPATRPMAILLTEKGDIESLQVKDEEVAA